MGGKLSDAITVRRQIRAALPVGVDQLSSDLAETKEHVEFRASMLRGWRRNQPC